MSTNKHRVSLRSIKPNIKPSGPSKIAYAETSRLENGAKKSVSLRYVVENKSILLRDKKGGIHEIRPIKISLTNIAYMTGNI